MTWNNLGSPRWTYERGLHDLGTGAYAWLQPNGGWGWSNAGLIVDSGEALLVDTLFDLAHTQAMLDAMRDAEPCAKNIGTLVNTHANGDHTFGNELVSGADIIATTKAAAEMEATPPARLQQLMKMAQEDDTPLGKFLRSCFSAFDFEGIQWTLPTETFDGTKTLTVGNKTVELIEVGPAHTAGDLLVYVPEDRTVFTGDILFIDGTPLLWAGPVDNWLAACDRLLAMDVETIVPGHGPITDKRGPEAVKAYLETLRDEAKKRFDAGLSVTEATDDIVLGDFSSWGDPERLAVNVDTLYRGFAGVDERTPVIDLFRRMAELKLKAIASS